MPPRVHRLQYIRLRQQGSVVQGFTAGGLYVNESPNESVVSLSELRNAATMQLRSSKFHKGPIPLSGAGLM
jgi:hypothetical protein